MALVSSNSVGDKFATGTTAQRPSSPKNGDIRFNTSLTSEAGTRGHIEFYANGWVQLNVRPTPGNAKVGYTATTSSGCEITGVPGRANQTSNSSQTVGLDKAVFLGWYKPPPIFYPIEAQFGLNYNSSNMTINAKFNVRAVHRWVAQESHRFGDAVEYDNKSEVIGKHVCYTGTNSTASCRIERSDLTYPNEHSSAAAPPPYLGNQKEYAVYHHRSIGLDYIRPVNTQLMGYRKN